MQQAQRAVFDRSIIEGYRTAKTDAIAVAAQGRRLFSGTSDGSVVMYDCKLDTIGTTSKTLLWFDIKEYIVLWAANAYRSSMLHL